MSIIKFENVGMRYGTNPEILHDVNFVLEPGSFHFLTGASGAGKSSLLRLLYLSHTPSRGLITILGKDASMLNRNEKAGLRRKIGVVFQDFCLMNHLSAFDNVALPLRLSGADEKRVKTEVTDLLKWVGLGDHLNDTPPTLSGGQKQRVAIARAVISQPNFIMADEPTGSVDDRVGYRLLRLFEELNKLGTTILIATHNESLVSRFGHPCLHIEKGVIHQDNSVINDY